MLLTLVVGEGLGGEEEGDGRVRGDEGERKQEHECKLLEMTLLFGHRNLKMERDSFEMTRQPGWREGKERRTKSKAIQPENGLQPEKGSFGFSRARHLSKTVPERRGLVSWPRAPLCPWGW